MLRPITVEVTEAPSRSHRPTAAAQQVRLFCRRSVCSVSRRARIELAPRRYGTYPVHCVVSPDSKPSWKMSVEMNVISPVATAAPGVATTGTS
jgi:hypothetical protein